jgi:hypothetical protein
MNNHMRFPIIELRENNLFVLNHFDGDVHGEEIKCKFNFYRNLTEYVIDSSGAVWEFQHIRHNNKGFRAAISLIWNVSYDFYLTKIENKKNIKWFRDTLKKYKKADNSDSVAMAEALLEPVSSLHEDTYLSEVINKLNL